MNPLGIMVCTLLQLGTPLSSVKPIAQHVLHYSQVYDINPLLVIAVIHHESRGYKGAHNKNTHDHGLMQIHCPSVNYAPWCKNVKKLQQLKHNIKTGIYLLYLKKRGCVGKHSHKSHWVRHNNWHNKQYDVRILRTQKRIEKMVESCLRKN